MIQISNTDLPRMTIFIPTESGEGARPTHYGSDFEYSKMKRYLSTVLFIY